MSLLMEHMIGLTDTAYLGRVGEVELGASALAGVYYLVIYMLGFGFSIGAQVLIARRNGAQEYKRIGPVFLQGTFFLLLLAALLFTASHLYSPFFLRKLIGSDDVYQATMKYVDWRVYGFFFSFVAVMFRAFYVGITKTKILTVNSVVMVLTNVMLNYVLIFGKFGLPALGIAGAAMATAMGQIIGGTIPLVYFLRKNSSSLRLRRPKWDGGALRRACTNGVSELMSSISMSIVGMLYNAQLMRYAGENGVAAYGTIMYVNFIFLAIFIGYATGVAPVISYHYGAGNKKELNNLLKRSVVLIAAASLSMLLLSEVMAAPLAAIFVGYDAGLLDMTVHAYSIYAVSFLFCGFSIFSSAFFTALGDGLTSALIAFLRTLVFESASVIILPLLLGLNGIWGAIIVAECMSVTVSVIFLVAKRKRYQYF